MYNILMYNRKNFLLHAQCGDLDILNIESSRVMKFYLTFLQLHSRHIW